MASRPPGKYPQFVGLNNSHAKPSFRAAKMRENTRIIRKNTQKILENRITEKCALRKNTRKRVKITQFYMQNSQFSHKDDMFCGS